MTRGRIASVRMDWRGGFGHDELELEDGLAALAIELRSEPPQRIRDLIGVDLWMGSEASGHAPATGLAILPYPETHYKWVKIDADGGETIACAACGRRVALAEGWLESGRVVCSSCRSDPGATTSHP